MRRSKQNGRTETTGKTSSEGGTESGSIVRGEREVERVQ